MENKLDNRTTARTDEELIKNQLQLLADTSVDCRDKGKVYELCKLSAAMVEIYKTINSPILDLFNQINERA